MKDRAKVRGLFITGATGLIGRALLGALDEERFPRVCCLTRAAAPPLWAGRACTVVSGCLLDRDAYREELQSADTVVHLAAATGKTMPEEYVKVNVEGTRALVEECRRAGVRNFLHVSTIAVKFKDKRRYYYAQSKELAEQIVQASGLNYVIVRPTIVIGRAAPAWNALVKMAKGRVIPIIGDGTTPIQPIYLDDLVTCLLFILSQGRFGNETIELGGPETITMKEFLKKIHFHLYGKMVPCIHIPRALLHTALSLVERFFFSLLPISVGQLAVFANDGTISSNDVFEQHASQMKRVEEMLRLLSAKETKSQSSDEIDLDRECRVFSRYLIGTTPDPYVAEKYREAHRVSDPSRGVRAAGLERLLLKMAVIHPAMARVVDVYCRVFLPSALVRRKCVLLLAILEVSASTHGSVDVSEKSQRSAVLGEVVWRGTLFMALVCVGTAMLGPLHLVLGSGDHDRPGSEG